RGSRYQQHDGQEQECEPERPWSKHRTSLSARDYTTIPNLQLPTPKESLFEETHLGSWELAVGGCLERLRPTARAGISVRSAPARPARVRTIARWPRRARSSSPCW